MRITRTIPDVRSTNVDKTVRFYTDLLGFDARTERGAVTAFVSASDPRVEVTLNADESLPPGFTVEVATPDDVAELAARAPACSVRVIEPLDDRGTKFSVLDPSGRRVTITGAVPGRPTAPATVTAPPTDRAIDRAIPGSTIEATAALAFYRDYLGFGVRHEWRDVLMFESSTTPGVQVLAGSNITSPDQFDLVVGTVARVDAIHAAAVGNAVVLGAPEDFPDYGIRCFTLVDPNGIAINVAGGLGT
jgi:catechol 2,3-dioxygenase-like lactoylglutathione lyase family enzyme